jgi:hypothetical protein
MNVQQLVEELSYLNPDAEVLIADWNVELNDPAPLNSIQTQADPERVILNFDSEKQ